MLRAFASGASALTGIEAIADGVQAFRRPKAHNAASTLGIMGAIAVTMFLGISTQARLFDVRVSEATLDSYGTVLSQIGRAVFGTGAGFIMLQIATMAILVLAANTAYQDFPRLSAILAAHRLMPRQYRNRGDRLVFSNGIITGGLAAGGPADRRVRRPGEPPDPVVRGRGVHLLHHQPDAAWCATGCARGRTGWQRSVVINAVGAVGHGSGARGGGMVKFTHGAWIILVAVPLFVAGMAAMRRHYLWVASRLRQVHPVDCSRPAPHRVVVLASRSGRHLDQALRFARLLHSDHLETWHVRGARRPPAAWRSGTSATPTSRSACWRRTRMGWPPPCATRCGGCTRRIPTLCSPWWSPRRSRARRWRHCLAHRNGGPSILWALRQESGVAVTDVNYAPPAQPAHRPGADLPLTLVSRRLVRMAGTSLDFGRSGPGSCGGSRRSC